MTGRFTQARLLIGLRRTLAARERYDASSPSEQAAWRELRLAELRHHATESSDFYRSRHHGLADAPLRELPVVTKSEIFGDFDAAVTDRRLTRADVEAHVEAGDPSALLGGRYRIGSSSGSSGRPGLFPFSPREWTDLLANAARSRQIIGRHGLDGQPRAAKVASPSGWHLSRQVAETLTDPRKPSLRLDATEGVGALVAALERWSPNMLSGYPSVLRSLAVEQLEGRLSLNPAQVLTSGEVLDAASRRLLVEAWGGGSARQPFDQYVTTETGFLAVECAAHQGLHVLDDHVLLEVVDEANQPVGVGEVGSRVLVTAYWNRTLPLIRYAIEDQVRLSTAHCPCGRSSPRIESIQGRARELLSLAGPRGDVSIHPVALTSVLDTARIGGWQVVYRRDHLEVRISQPRSGFEPADLRRRLLASLIYRGASGVEVAVVVVPAIDRAVSGKALLISRQTGSN